MFDLLTFTCVKAAVLKDYFLQICILTEVKMFTALVTLQDLILFLPVETGVDIVLRVPTQIV
ncbi:hypothetical protein DN756_20615 [Yersinia pseudotuberculosis]|nr:hypothetical protein EGX87_00620 [Yersinia pseudotuberculosis]AYW85988.1 hypothetical protein EGX87_01410 [Yersinia pseudotuberculosis]AYX00492.1 hypothetical protein EGX53_11825 [Yersinia pseudotuberculosis]AYX00626.1 hypothetical protein EGX53_12615 [Yersinia pseudotuberculosis]AZA32057.1 hypothetical protein DN756_19820 [Yersinia pseudotuberculosis]